MTKNDIINKVLENSKKRSTHDDKSKIIKNSRDLVLCKSIEMLYSTNIFEFVIDDSFKNDDIFSLKLEYDSSMDFEDDFIINEIFAAMVQECVADIIYNDLFSKIEKRKFSKDFHVYDMISEGLNKLKEPYIIIPPNVLEKDLQKDNNGNYEIHYYDDKQQNCLTNIGYIVKNNKKLDLIVSSYSDDDSIFLLGDFKNKIRLTTNFFIDIKNSDEDFNSSNIKTISVEYLKNIDISSEDVKNYIKSF